MIRAFSPSGAVARRYTTQLYFDDSLTDKIVEKAPYNTRGLRSMRNSADSLYARGTQLSLAAGDAGYTTHFLIGLKT